jgi:hypothetical protein
VGKINRLMTDDLREMIEEAVEVSYELGTWENRGAQPELESELRGILVAIGALLEELTNE